jgi:hypothetical protein
MVNLVFPALPLHSRARGTEGISRKLRMGQYRRNIKAIKGEFIPIIKLKMVIIGTGKTLLIG